MSFPFKPLSNYIVVQIIPKFKGNIVIPDTVKKPMTPEEAECLVIAVSEEKDINDRPMVRTIKVGDKVIFSMNVRHTGEAIMIKKQEYVICRETDVIGLQLESFTEDEVIN